MIHFGTEFPIGCKDANYNAIHRSASLYINLNFKDKITALNTRQNTKVIRGHCSYMLKQQRRVVICNLKLIGGAFHVQFKHSLKLLNH